MSIAKIEPGMHPGSAFDGVIARLWAARRMNTYDIGAHLYLPESFVANRLAVIRDAGRQ